MRSPISPTHYSFGELRVSHEQNLIFADVEPGRLLALWQRAEGARPRHAEHRPADQHHLLPGRRLLLARQREVDPDRRGDPARFDDLDYLHDIGELDLNISGCMNACGHHHVGHIGILGVDKNGEEWYQVSIGGTQGNDAAHRQGDRPVVRRGTRCPTWSPR